MRLPSGYGSIRKLSGKRRRPFAVRITTGWTDEGEQIRKYLGYFATRREALEALDLYNQNPYNLDSRSITFSQLYEKWAEWEYKGAPIPHCYTAAFHYFSPVQDTVWADLKVDPVQDCIDRCPLGYSTKKNLKTLLNKMTKYSDRMELPHREIVSLLKLPPKTESRLHRPFTPAQIKTLWEHLDDAGARMALIYIYTGLRPTELLKIKTENVHLDQRYMMGGMKTAAGKNRVIPIAEKIFPLVQGLYDPGHEYLVMDPKDGQPMLGYDRLNEHIWKRSPILRPMQHLPHDCRHTCATLLSNAGVELKIIQLILGHSSKDITNRVYTHKTIGQLVEAINQI